MVWNSVTVLLPKFKMGVKARICWESASWPVARLCTFLSLLVMLTQSLHSTLPGDLSLKFVLQKACHFLDAGEVGQTQSRQKQKAQMKTELETFPAVESSCHQERILKCKPRVTIYL